MPLVHLLYRCPACGQDPVRGTRDLMTCPGCDARYQRSPTSGRIVVHGTKLWSGPVDAGVLLDRIEELGGPFTAARRPDGTVLLPSGPAFLSISPGEEPIRAGNRLVGFTELQGEELPGTLRATEKGLRFLLSERGSGSEVEDPSRSYYWLLEELTALQISTTSLQLSLADGALIQVRLITDSPLRWEVLLQGLIRDVWRATGRGEVLEFQPRIVSVEGA